jgi:hypothetical protein
MDETRPTGKRYSVGQLAQMAGVSARTLRHYEDMGLLEPARAENGHPQVRTWRREAPVANARCVHLQPAPISVALRN